MCSSDLFGGLGGRSGLGRPGGLLDVLLADAPAHTGAGDGGQVDPLVLGEPAHDRGDVGGGGDGRGGRRRTCTITRRN